MPKLAPVDIMLTLSPLCSWMVRFRHQITLPRQKGIIWACFQSVLIDKTTLGHYLLSSFENLYENKGHNHQLMSLRVFVFKGGFFTLWSNMRVLVNFLNTYLQILQSKKGQLLLLRPLWRLVMSTGKKS